MADKREILRLRKRMNKRAQVATPEGRQRARESNRRTYEKHRVRFRDKKKAKMYWLHYCYGITLEDYEKMLVEQKFLCVICGIHASATKGGRLHVDHDHGSGVVRGLLCHLCNKGIGSLGDNIERLEAAVRYLRSHKNG